MLRAAPHNGGMFIAIPLENKPSWRSPPWMTLLLIAINCLVFLGWQGGEQRAVQRSAKLYAATELPAIELPLFVQYLEKQGQQEGDDTVISKLMLSEARLALKEQRYEVLYRWMEQEMGFRKRLLADEVIKPGDPRYADWRAAGAVS